MTNPKGPLYRRVYSGQTYWDFVKKKEETFNHIFDLALAIAPGEVVNPRILDRVALREQVPAIALSLGVLALGLAPELLSNLSEAATTGLSQISGGLS